MESTRTEGRAEPVASGKRALVRGCRMRTVIAALVGLIFVAQVSAAEVSVDNPPQAGFAAGAVRHVVVTVNKSRTFRAEKPFTKAIVGSAAIVDVLPMSNQVLFLQGKKLGATNVSIFDADAQLIEILDVEVAIDTAGMQQKIQASTGIKAIRVSANGSQVILTGLVPDTVVADRALAVARGLAGDAVVNAMQVAPAQQVMLEVRFLEVSRSAGRDLGVNWFGANAGGTKGFNTGSPGTQSPITSAGAGGVPVFTTAGTLLNNTTTGPFATVLASVFKNGNASLDVLVTALEQKGLVRRLAEPNLMALSGDTARFLAGGEFPVPSVQPSSSGGQPIITTQYKPFGVQLSFVPTVLSRGVINLRVEPSVSELDFTNAVTISGTQIPSLITRDARTTVELRDGQSFAIAGLLQSRSTRDLSQVPWIGSVPVLGALFRSSDYQQQETDLVVIVTPRLVAPAMPGQRLASPLDARLPSNDVDFFLNGQPEVRQRYNDFVTSGGDVKGPYGHIIVPEYGSNNVVVKSSDIALKAKN
jgi:pilus assembly protein CpaC